MTCADVGPDLVAVALGQADASEAARIEAHVAACAPCRAELTATRRLLGIAQAEPLPACAPGAEERLLAAVRDERNATSGNIPAPVVKPRRAQRIVQFIVPLAAAAAVLVAITISGRERPAQVVDGEGFHFAEDDPSHPGTALGRGIEGVGAKLREFSFRAGDEVAAGSKSLSVRLSLPAGIAATGATQPAPGTLEIELAPGARIVRRDGSGIELLAGSIDVAAGPLAEPFVVAAPPNSATVRGTRFTASTAEKRMVVVVTEGSVEIANSSGRSAVLAAGQEGLIDAGRLLTRASDGRGARQVFLTPKASLVLVEPAGAKKPLLTAALRAGEGGHVSVLPFHDSEPRFLLRLKGDDGLEREVKIQRSMLVRESHTRDESLGSPSPPSGAVHRYIDLSARSDGYELVIDPSSIGVPPGRYQATLRYVSYRARSDGTEWLGVVESESIPIEVPAK